MTLRSKQGQEQMSLFHPTTTWELINQWLKNFTNIIDSPVNDYAFFDKNQKIILEGDQSISSTMEQTTSAIIDGLSRDTITNVVFSYETNSVSFDTLKSMRVSHLLNNEHLLRQLQLIDISPNDCVLVLGENNEQILSQDDIRQPIGNYSNSTDQSIHFRISISIQLFKYDDQQSIQILLSNRNTTIEHIFQLSHAPSNIYQYLASNSTKKILDYSEKLSNLTETKFLLVKEHETCRVTIEKLKCNLLLDIENDIHQRYTIFATIADLYRENQYQHQHLLYSNDFVPSIDTQLNIFRSISPIRFTLIDGNLPVVVTVQNSDNQQSIQFHCSVIITIDRLCSIACQLFNVNRTYYKLMQDDCLMDDDDVTLADIDAAMIEVQFQLVSTTSVNSSIKYGEQTVLLPCSSDTSIATLIRETLQKLYIPQEHSQLYELIALADERILIDEDMSIDDVYQLFPSHPTTIPFELSKKDD